MHANKNRILVVGGVMFTTAILAALAAAGDEVEITLDQVPPAVKKTILREAADSKITEIEMETMDGDTIYETEFEKDGRQYEIEISPNGVLMDRRIEEDDELDIDQIPRPARNALLQLAGGAKISEVERDETHGVAVFEAEWTAGGTQHEAAVMGDGTLVETEKTIPLDKAPAAVRAAIAKHFGDQTAVVVEKKSVIVYEAEAEIDGKEIEILVFPTGRVHEEHDDDEGDDDDNENDDD